MDQIHLRPLVDQIQLTLGHISNKFSLNWRPRRSCKNLYRFATLQMLEICWSLNHIFLVRSIYHQRPDEASVAFVLSGPQWHPGTAPANPLRWRVGGQQWTRRTLWTRLFISTQPRWPGGEVEAVSGGGGDSGEEGCEWRFRGVVDFDDARAGTSAPSASTSHSTTTTVSLGFNFPPPIICSSF
jgi:hypothetical protein